jgi:hypothetical protein
MLNVENVFMKSNLSVLKFTSKDLSSIKILTVSILFVFAGLLCGSGWGANSESPDCQKCPKITEEIKNYKKQADQANSELQRQRQAMTKLSPDQDSKRMRITSQLFVLAAKAETAENMITTKENERQFNCLKCGPAKR